MRWDPNRYARYADDRGRPFLDLLARVDAQSPHRVVDLGCGPGNLTALLVRRWPEARVHGIDSSPEMIDAARKVAGPHFEVGDIAQWPGAGGADVIVSNAALQWVPGHLDLLRTWSAQLRPGAWLACQVPGNFTAPSHTLMREIAQKSRWRARLDGVLRHEDAVAEPADYARLLLEAGLRTDVWTTTYLHVLPGEDAVLDWVMGTGLRPVLAALADDPQACDAYVAEYAAALRQAYPRGPGGTVLPFRRVFAVAHRPA